MSSPTRGREPEDDSTPGDDLDRALRELIEHEQGAGSSGDVPSAVEATEDLTLLAGWEVQQHKPPAVLCIRAVDFREPLVGRRARFWLTSFGELGDLIVLGWRDGLRIVSEVQDLRGQVDRVVEPTVSVQEEGDYYRALTGEKNTRRFAAGVSRVWVEQYVSQPDLGDDLGGADDEIAPNTNAWLADVVEDPGAPRLMRPAPARAVHSLTGRRVFTYKATAPSSRTCARWGDQCPAKRELACGRHPCPELRTLSVVAGRLCAGRRRVSTPKGIGMEDHLCHAVVDGPDGHHAVALPNARASALQMKIRHHRRFWCSRTVGGCGAPLIVAAGPILRPHFRHPPGGAHSCAFGRDPDRAKAAYTHLAIQLALVGLLDGQGFASRIEHVFKDGGRADLHVVIGDDAQTIEVQLSPMPEAEWVRRDGLYRSQVSVVTWLYGPDSEARGLDEMIERDVSLHVDADVDADGADVQIGTGGIGMGGIDTLEWAKLDDCKLTPEGFWTPHLEGARAATVAWRAEEDAKARQEADEEAERRRRQQELVERGKRERADAEARWQRTRRTLPPVRATRAGRYSWTVTDKQLLLPEAGSWAPSIGWDWLNDLPTEFHASARLFAFLVCRILSGGPLHGLAFDDVPDPDGLIVDALLSAGLIALCEPTPHPRRWQRPDFAIAAPAPTIVLSSNRLREKDPC